VSAFAFLLLSALSIGEPPALPADSVRFQPDQTFVLGEGTRVALFQSGWAPVQPVAPITLRIFFPLGESPDEAGAAQILRMQAERRMRVIADRVGLQVRVERTSAGLVYWASGPTGELDTLIWALNEGLRAPDPEGFAALRRSQLAVVLRGEETPEGVLASRLRTRLGSSQPPLRGTRAALETMDPSRVTAVWARSHARDRMQVVAVGTVAPATLLGALTDLKLPDTPPMVQLPPPRPTQAPRGAPETIRHWMAEAWAVERPRDPRALVAIALLGEAARARSETGTVDLGAELWEVDGRWFLILSGAAYPAQARTLRPLLDSLIPGVMGSLDHSRVVFEAQRIYRDLHHQAATPQGLARLVGEAQEADLPPEILSSFLQELQILESADMRRFFEGLLESLPFREEIRP